MSRRNFQSILCAGLVLAAIVRAVAAPLGVGDKFPELSGIALEGKLPALEGRVLVVDFWASWCGPCKEAFPALARVHAWYGQRGVVVLGVSVDQKENEYADFLKKFAVRFPTVRDHEQKLVALVQVPAMPTTYVIGRDGRVRAILSGYHGAATDKELRTTLNTILAENSSP